MPPIPHPPSRASRKKFLGISLFLFTLGVGVFFLYGSIRHENKTSPQQSIKAHVIAERILLSFGANGTLHTLAASEGDKVGTGTILAAQDSANQLWQDLVSAEQGLARARLALPADYVDKSEGNNNLSVKDQLDLLMASEEELRKKQEEASIAEAKAALAYTRTLMSQTRQRSPQEHIENARKEYLAAKDSTLYIAMQFEKTSIERAAAEQRLKDVITSQQKSGSAAIPVALRINNYEIQRDHVVRIRQRLAAATIIAPADGVINRIFGARYHTVHQGEPIIAFMPTHHFSKILYITGYTDSAESLTQGTACEIRIPALTNATFMGKTIAVPGIKPDATVVWVEVPLDDTMPRLQYIPTEAQVTFIKK